MAIYTVSITDGTTLANLAVSAGRGPKGDGFTGVTFDNTTKTFTFTSNDGLGFTSDPITIDLLADPTPQLGGNLDLNSNDITGTGDINITGGMTLTGAINGPSTFTIDPAGHGDNTGTVIIAGNLQVDGTTTTINSQTLDVADLNITVASGAADAASADGAGLTVDGANATLTYVAAGDKWVFNKPVDVTTLTATTADINGGTIDGTVIGGSTPAAISGTTGSFSGNLTVDTNTLFVDAANNRVGIGTSSPDRKLTLSVSPSSATDDGVKVVEGSNNAVLARTGSAYSYKGVGASSTLLYSNNTLSFLADGSSNMTFHNGGNERMRIDASGNVGIGVVPTTDHNPVVEALQIGSTANLFGRNDAEITTLTSNSYLSLAGYPKYITTNEASEYIQTSGNHIWYNAPSGTAGATCTQTERMRIDASGNLLVGKTSAGIGTAGFQANPTGDTYNTVSGNITAYYNRLSSDGDIVQFRKDGTTVGSIASKDGDLAIGTGTVGVRFLDGSSAIVPQNHSTNSGTDGLLDLGVGAARFKDLYLSGGVYLGGTGPANLLDDYEEGTWTVQLWAGGTQLTLSEAGGCYVKIGRLVVINFEADVSNANAASGALELRNLPFTVADIITPTGIEANGSCSYWQNWSTGINSLNLYAEGGTATAFVTCLSSSTATSSQNATAAFIGTGEFRGTITYFTT